MKGMAAQHIKPRTSIRWLPNGTNTEVLSVITYKEDTYINTLITMYIAYSYQIYMSLHIGKIGEKMIPEQYLLACVSTKKAGGPCCQALQSL